MSGLRARIPHQAREQQFAHPHQRMATSKPGPSKWAVCLIICFFLVILTYLLYAAVRGDGTKTPVHSASLFDDEIPTNEIPTNEQSKGEERNLEAPLTEEEQFPPGHVRNFRHRLNIREHRPDAIMDGEKIEALHVPRLGHRGLTMNNNKWIPWVGFGTAGLKNSTQAVSWALDEGYRMIDTAAQVAVWYQNEIAIGNELARRFAIGRLGRHDIIIQTKLHPQDHGTTSARRSVETSLKNLRTDYIDVLIVHYPWCWGDVCDKNVVVEGSWKDSWRTLEQMYTEGKIRAIGVSNFWERELNELAEFAKIGPHLVQNHFDPFYQARSIRKICKRNGWHFQAYSLLGTQWLYKIGGNPVFTHKQLQEIAERHNKNVAQTVLRWAIQHGISVLPKSNSLVHIAQNYQVMDFFLSSEEMDQIDALDGTLKFE